MLIALILPVLIAAPAQAMETTARHALLIDMTTNAVLFEKESAAQMPPASMSKLMTLYLVFEHIREGSLSLDDTFTVSENAWRKGGAKSGSSTMFLEPGERVRVEDLIRGVAVQSGNDACIVLAEGLSVSEASFAEEMTRMGRELGLTDSTFRNSTGWPQEGHVMSARDLARLAERSIADHPEYYHYYSELNFSHNGIDQGNRNPLLYRDMGVDGLKTGHTEDSGYGLTASAERDGRRLILVLNGLPSVKARAQESERLLERGFREFNNYALFRRGDTVSEAEVWLGSTPTVPLVIEDDLTVTLPRKSRGDMKVTVAYDGPVPAPITAGTQIATLVVSAPDAEPKEIPLVAGADVELLGFVGRLGAALRSVIWGFSS